MQSNDSNSDLYMCFTSTNSMYEVTGGKGQLVIENVSKVNSILIEDVVIEGAGGKTDIAVPVTIRPGEKITVTINAADESFGSITVTYIESDNYLNTKTKTEYFSVTDNYSGQLTNATEQSVAGNNVFALVMRIILAIVNYFKSALLG